MEQAVAVLLWIGRNSRRMAVTAVGVVLLLAGVAMLLLPGPGLLGIAAGLAVLGTEYAWARRALRQARAKARDAGDRIPWRKAS